MQSLPPKSPLASLVRMHRLARTDGLVLMIVAGTFAALGAYAKDGPSAIAGVLAAGAGAVELHGATLLAAGFSRNRAFLVGSQVLLLGTILAYSAWRASHPDLDRIRSLLTPEMKVSISTLGFTVDQFLLIINHLTYAILAAVSLLYQGGMAWYYFFRQRSFRDALTGD